MADASTHTGEDAVEEGFADEVMTLPELMQEEFSLDQEAEETETEQTLQFVSDRYMQLRGRFEDMQDDLQSLAEENETLRERVNEQRVDAVLQTAIDEKHKISKGRRDELRQMLEEDFEGTKNMLDMIEEGAAAPSESLQEDTNLTTNEEAIQKLQDRGVRVVHDPEKAKAYESYGWKEGEDFVMAENAVDFLEDGTT